MTTDSAKGLLGAMPANLAGLLSLFEELPEVIFSVKDSSGRYVAVNRAFVARTGKRSRRDVLGHRASELFVPELAERYEEQDAEVVRSGKPLKHELEVIRRPGGEPGWYVTTKIVWTDGTMGPAVLAVSTDLKAAAKHDSAMQALRHVVARVEESLAEHPDRRIRAADLADDVGCSVATLERRMTKVFGLSVRQFVTKARTDLAMRLLATSSLPIAQVADRCGFYDQASFTKQFASLTGETPAQFRRSSQRRQPS